MAGSLVVTRPDLRSCALAAIAATLGAGQQADHARNGVDKDGELAFLSRHYALAGGAAWPETLLRCIEAPVAADRPIAAISGALELSAHEILALVLALAVEEDVAVGRALARVQAPSRAGGALRPTLGLVGTLLDGCSPLALANGAALGSGLLYMVEENLPLPERALALPLHIAMALGGLDAPPPGTRLGLHEPLRLPATLLAEAERHAATLAGGPRHTLLLRGSALEGRALAAEIARLLGLRPLFVDPAQLPAGLAPLLLLRALLPVFRFGLAPGERAAVPDLGYYSGPALCICGTDGQLDHGDRPGALASWSIPIPSPEERLQLWQHAIGDRKLAQAMADNYRHSAERIGQIGRLALYQAGLDGRAQPCAEDVWQATRRGVDSGLDALAQPLADDIADEALVIDDEGRRALELLRLRSQARDRLPDGLGEVTRARCTPGVRALFIGPSGTGKTLAASWLATRLGLPLYRVDLASVTSKYIGETEKNLAELLTRAERAGVILLFDEADSMFGKRTDIKDSHDRFANAQTNFLLQRIETFDGIALLTSNSRQQFDSAFVRRLDAIIEFPLPSAERRGALWRAHLGDQHALSEAEITHLAFAADFAGGHIRNAVLTAAVLAQAERRTITYADLLRGVADEFAKLGRQLPPGLWPAEPGRPL